MDERFNKVVNLFKERTEKECYKIICLDEEPEIMDNKIGGVPYYPIGEEYPLDDNGNPMALLLQVDLSKIKLEDYPENGILEVFIDSEVGYPCQYKIKYFNKNLEHNDKIPFVSLDRFITRKPIKITFEKDITHMTFSNYKFVSTLCSIINEVYETNISTLNDIDNVFKEIGDWYEPFTNQLRIHGGNIGGYPDFTQSDPRNRKNEDLDECLFKIDSELSKSIMIGDCGIIFGLISNDNIKTSQFEKCFVDWDCC